MKEEMHEEECDDEFHSESEPEEDRYFYAECLMFERIVCDMRDEN